MKNGMLRGLSESDLQERLNQARQDYELARDLAEDPSQPGSVKHNARRKRRAAGRRIDRCLNEQKRRGRWATYEQEKQMIREQNLAPADYETAIGDLAKRLGI